jgi:hypothetical protein
MSASVQIDEYNGVGETETSNITNSNMGSVDAPNLNAAVYPITAGNNSYEKWQKLHVTAMGGAISIDDLRIWRTGALGSGAATHKTNARTTSYAGAATYATPTATASSIATQTMPIADPGSANLGISGNLTNQIVAPGESDYLVHQITTDVTDTIGSTTTMNYQYREIA